MRALIILLYKRHFNMGFVTLCIKKSKRLHVGLERKHWPSITFFIHPTLMAKHCVWSILTAANDIPITIKALIICLWVSLSDGKKDEGSSDDPWASTQNLLNCVHVLLKLLRVRLHTVMTTLTPKQRRVDGARKRDCEKTRIKYLSFSPDQKDGACAF